MPAEPFANPWLPLALLALLNLWIAWRYSGLPLGQDEGLWLLWGYTGARPYVDHVDCKPPGVHVWAWLLARLAGRRLRLTRFLHFSTVGAGAVAAAALTGNFYVGLMFTALAQSAWLFAYQDWLDAMSATLLLLALLLPPWPAALFLALAVFFSLKLGPAALLILLLHGWWLQLFVLGGVAMLAVVLWRFASPGSLRAVWYGAVTTTRRIAAQRKKNGGRFWPRWDNYLAVPLLLLVPALAMSIWNRPEPAIWLPALAYVITNGLGRHWRPYHWLPLAAFAAVAAPASALFILLAEWCASGFYLGDIVRRTRPGAAPGIYGARQAGRQLAQLPGSLWVADEFTQLYVYARKRPHTRLVEQVEIRHVVPERRAVHWRPPNPPDLVAQGPQSAIITPPGYRLHWYGQGFRIFAGNGGAGQPHQPVLE